MNLFDIVGPVMIGPSSSHTAGAARIGNVCHKLMGEDIVKADIFLHGSFLQTGKGHGTDKAIVGGLLGLSVDDMRIPESFDIAKDRGLSFNVAGIDLGDVHPNTAKLVITGKSGRTMSVIACSLGGGRIEVCELDGIAVKFSGEYPTIIVRNLDEPGQVTNVTGLLGEKNINIATMQVYRKKRGDIAVMVLECDQEVSIDTIRWLEQHEGIVKVSYLSLKE